VRSAVVSFVLLAVGCGASFQVAPVVVADRPRPAAVAPTTGAPIPTVMPTGSAPIVTLPEIVEKRLSNGIRVLLLPRHEYPIVDFSFVMLRGAADAPPGFANVWLEAATTSTPDLSPVAMFTWLRARGAVAHRSTGYEYCSFGVKVVTPLLRQTLDVAAQALLSASIPDTAVPRATRHHSASVISARNAPDSIAYAALVAALYPADHVYSHTVVGEDIHPSRSELEAFSRRTIDASHLAFVAAGDFDPESLTERLEATLGKLPRAESKRAEIPSVPARKRRAIVITRGRDPQVQVTLGFLAPPAADADRAALHVTSLALNDVTRRALRLVDGATYGTFLFESTRSGPAPILIRAALEPERAPQALDDLWHTVDQLRAGPPSDEVARLRDRAIALFPARFGDVSSARVSLEGLAAMALPTTEPAAELEALRKVGPEDVKRVAEKYMNEDSLQLVVVGEPRATASLESHLEYRAASSVTAPPR